MMRFLNRLRPARMRPRILPMAILCMVAVMLLKGMHLVQAAGGAPAALATASRAMLPPAQAAGSHAAAKETTISATLVAPPRHPQSHLWMRPSALSCSIFAPAAWCWRRASRPWSRARPCKLPPSAA